jgi:hypothetical protein
MANDLNHVGLTLPKSSLPRSLHSAFSNAATRGIVCYIDGSYLQLGDTGEGCVAVVIKEEDHLIVYSVQSFQALSPLHTEVHTMELTLQELTEKRIVHGSIFTDCK